MKRALAATLGVKVRAQEAISWVGLHAREEPTEQGREAAILAAELAMKYGDLILKFEFPLLDVMVKLCDALRESGNHAALPQAERVIHLIKHGQRRHILGTINLTLTDPRDLDAKLEGLRAQVLKGVERSEG